MDWHVLVHGHFQTNSNKIPDVSRLSTFHKSTLHGVSKSSYLVQKLSCPQAGTHSIKEADHGNRPETIHLRAGFILLQEVYEADIPLFWPRAASLEISEKVQKSRDLRPSLMLEACERPTTRSSCSIEFERSDRCDPVLNCYLRQVKMASGQVAFSKLANVVSVAGWDLCAASIDEP